MRIGQWARTKATARVAAINMKLILVSLLAALSGFGLFHLFKPLPPGLDYRGPWHPLRDPQLLTDITWRDDRGQIRSDQHIFDEIFRLIDEARRLIVVDMFLFDDSGGGPDHRPLARELTEALVARRRAVPDMDILVVSDPFNSLYGGTRSPWFQRLRQAGITVVETDLTRLRDPNPLWSAVWRLCCQWLGNDPDGGWLPHAAGDSPVTLRSYLALLNFKANHRKTLIVDEGEGLRGLVTSANPHDGSSRHHNVALGFGGPAALDLLRSELAVPGVERAAAGLSSIPAPEPVTDDAGPEGRILTEAAIRDAALAMIEGAPADSALDLAMFYLSHREVVQALIRARERGVRLRVLLDANHDAFGREKNGIPNRQTAMELHRAGVPVRWCNTHGEQCHTKLLLRRDPEGTWQLLLGSANFTRRNLDNFNLETDIQVRGHAPAPLSRRAADLFGRYWHQGKDDNPTLSLPYAARADESVWRYWRYRLMEASGLSTF